jgi:hypothetical protein
MPFLPTRYGSNDGMENLTRTTEKNAKEAAARINAPPLLAFTFFSH